MRKLHTKSFNTTFGNYTGISFCGRQFSMYNLAVNWEDTNCLKCMQILLKTIDPKTTYCLDSYLEVQKKYYNLTYGKDFEKLLDILL